MRKMNRKATNKYIIQMLLSGDVTYTSVGKRFSTNPQSVKTIFFRELEKILLVADWMPWLIFGQHKFTDLNLDQFRERKRFILERMACCGW